MRCTRCGDSPCIFSYNTINRCVVCGCTTFTDGKNKYGDPKDETVKKYKYEGYGYR